LHNKEFKDFFLIYIDDILFFSNKDLEDHFKKVELVLSKCFEHGVVLSEKKVVIAQNKIKLFRTRNRKRENYNAKACVGKTSKFSNQTKGERNYKGF